MPITTIHELPHALVIAGILLMTSACGHKEPPPPPAVGSLTRTFDLLGADGVHYGKVEMDPVGGGKVYDSNGRLIGDIVPPER